MNIYLVERKLDSPSSAECHSAVVAAETSGEARSLVAHEAGERHSLWREATATIIGRYTALTDESHVILLSWGPTARPLPGEEMAIRGRA